MLHDVICFCLGVCIYRHFASTSCYHSRPPAAYSGKRLQINGREYIDNGIVFDIPKVGDPSREATVVSFPNRAVIPGYISVDGVKYTVRKIYMAANTWLGDTASWVTLPPTLTDCKNFTRRYYWGSSKSGKRYKILGVTNINVTDLNSFFNSDFTDQTPYNVYDDIRFLDHSYKPQYPMWRLYLNGEPVIDIVYPEGSKMGVSLLGLSYINSITIPASDTCRNKTFGEQWQLLKFPLALDEWMKWGRNPKNSNLRLTPAMICVTTISRWILLSCLENDSV